VSAEIVLNKRKNFPALDWVRGAAALSVFTHHFYQQFLSRAFDNSSYFGAFMAHLGSWGVAIFFVLSGFCIHWGRLLDSSNKGGFQPRIFAIRRFFRIYPAMLFSILLCYELEKYYTSNLLQASSLGSVLAHLTLISSFMVDQRVAVNSVLWSVIVECHFYILYWLFWRHFDGIRNVAAVTAVALALGAATFAASVVLAPSGPYRVMLQTIFLASWWSWCFGALIAELIYRKRMPYTSQTVNRVFLFGALLMSILIGLLPHPFELHARRFVLPCLAGAFIYFLLNDRYDFSKARSILFVGVISYSLYLFHPVAILIGLHSDFAVIFAAVFVLTAGILLAYLSYRFIEIPFIQLGRRFVRNLVAPAQI
jgi:peptidoglycan/LPS O-acetylase OafA/YrhL